MANFVIKSQEELEKMSAVELQAYYSEKLTAEKTELNNRIKALEDEKNTEKYNELEKEIKSLKDEKLNTLMEAVKTQGIVLEKIKSGELSGSKVKETEDFVVSIIDQYRDDFKKASTDRHSFKVAGDFTLAGNVSGGTVPQPQRLEGINDIAERNAVVYNLTPKMTTMKNNIEWVYETNQDGTSDGVAEGAAKDQLDNDFVVANISLIKRAVYFKVSTETLADEPLLASWFRNKLLVRLMLDVDSQVLVGSNATNQMNGIYTQATAFAAGTFAASVDNANNVDSLVVAINQIRLANHNGALTIVLHPSDLTALKLVKLSTTDKRYLDRLIEVASSNSLDGNRIVTTTAMTAGTFLVGDFSKAMVVEKAGGMSLDIGLDGNDFTKNMRTILAEYRGNVVIETNNLTAFVKGTFATTNAALETT